MVSVKLQGRTGNQLFQKACVIGYAIKHGLEYDISKSSENGDIVLNESSFNYEELPFIEDWRKYDIVISGYRQSWKYFDHCKEEVIKAFNIPYEKREGWVGLHNRRGDYLTKPDYHPVITIEYITKSIDYFNNIGYNKFIVCGDDPSWNHENINEERFPNCVFEYSKGRTALEDMAILSGCSGLIGSNSSYSLWCYFLNRSPFKIGIFPKIWFGSQCSHDTKDLYPIDCLLM